MLLTIRYSVLVRRCRTRLGRLYLEEPERRPCALHSQRPRNCQHCCHHQRSHPVPGEAAPAAAGDNSDLQVGIAHTEWLLSLRWEKGALNPLGGWRVHSGQGWETQSTGIWGTSHSTATTGRCTRHGSCEHKAGLGPA